MPTYEEVSKPFLSIADIAGLLGVSEDTVYKWSRRGRPHFPCSFRLPNGQIRVTTPDFATWLKAMAR